jgi:cell division protein FtsB
MVPDNSTQEISCKGSKKATQVSNLKQKLAQKEERIQKLVAENGKLKEECALLRGRLHLLMQLHSKK